MRKNSSDCKLLNEILVRQRRIRRNSLSRSAFRTITKGLYVIVPKTASQRLSRRKKQFQKAVDIFVHSSCKFDRVNEPQRSRAAMNRSHKLVDRMISTFLNLPRSYQCCYLACADMMDFQNRVTVCSDPFLLFLQDFIQECNEMNALEKKQIQPVRESQAPNFSEDDLDDDEIDDPILVELPGKEQILSMAKHAWDVLSDAAREPYRFRAIMAAFFPINMDQAF
ncbi:uncharacterized protein LOC126565374 [Anopheles maculipalpis]|uniref:uncharacterized protein LOC126565374 n=1 Tax=Anopheles maculipalpis TaxID=1496333 RepID=UPI002158E9DD|nr:uncharacterized protein LOC126565374 [Anopheles maculipalpis]